MPGVTSRAIDQVFGFVDDNDGEDIELAPIDVEIFNVTKEVNMCTVAHHKSTLEKSPDLEILSVRLDTEAMTEANATRNCMFFPFGMVPLVLDKCLTPRQAFLVLHAHITTAGLLNECTNLLDFLRVSATTPTLSTEPLNTVDQLGTSVRHDKQVMKYFRKMSFIAT